MGTHAPTATVQTSIVVNAPAERAFRLFTERFDRIKPPDRTRVELEHRHLDRHGDGWEGTREGFGGAEGWPLYLERFATAVAETG